MTLLWLGLAASVLPWWVDTPAGSITDTGRALTAAGQVTGLMAGYLLLVQVLLMSRLPMGERLIGAERLVRWHRDLGAALVVTALGHTCLMLVGYAVRDGVSVWAEIDVLLGEYDHMVTAFAAAGLLLALGLLGIRTVRRAVPYEVWLRLHLSGYAVLMLGYGHQFAYGQQLSQPGPARSAAIGCYLAVVAAVLWGRVFTPLRLNARHRLRVAAVVPESADTVSVHLTGRRLHHLDVRAGQFLRWRFLARGLWGQAHPFSLSAAGDGRRLRITVKVVGRYTRTLRGVRPGTRVWISGPAGAFTAQHRTRDTSLLIAGGSGIAPLRALLEELPPRGALIYRARAAADVVFNAELDRLAHERGTRIWYVTGRRDDPGPRYVLSTHGLRHLVPDVARRDVWLCGPPGMVADVTRTLSDLGVPRRQVHVATFDF